MRIVVKDIRSDDDIPAIFNEQIVLIPFPHGVAGHRDAATTFQVHIHFHVAEDIARDRDIAPTDNVESSTRFAAAEDTNVRRSRRVVVVLQGAAGNGNPSYAVTTVRTVDENVCRRRSVGAHVVLEIAAGDVDVSDIACPHHDPTEEIVANMTADNVRLVKSDIVIVDADPGVLEEMAIRDDHFAVFSYEMNTALRFSNVDEGQGHLRNPIGLDSNGFGMVAADGHTIDEGHPLTRPDTF